MTTTMKTIFVEFPYDVTSPSQNNGEHNKKHDWCADNGFKHVTGKTPFIGGRWIGANTVWSFENERDAILFALRWA